MMDAMAANGKYRLRTWLRGHTPYVLSDRIAKGRGVCGEHEWYYAGGTTWECYHCEPGVTRVCPWPRDEWVSGRMAALMMLVDELESSEPTVETTAEYRRTFAEMKDLPGTERDAGHGALLA